MPLHRRNRRTGFTLIELLVVVVVIGILASIAMAKFRSTKGKAFYASVKTDLQNLVTAQEAYFYDVRQYTTRLDSLKVTGSPGVVITIGHANATEWSATAYHPSSFPHTCAIYFGDAPVLPPATAPGQVSCN